MRTAHIVLCCVCWLVGPSALGLTANAMEVSALESKALAIIETSCAECHSHKRGKMKGSLALDTLAMALEGGDTGPALVPGNAQKSLLIKAIHYTDEDLQMPPKDKRLSAEDIATLEKWVVAGAPWQAKPSNAEAIAGRPARKPGRITDEDRAWWSYQPLANITPPNSDEKNEKGQKWARNSIDQFIAKRLSEAHLTPAPEADKLSLLRRATFSVTGLPPTPEETSNFLADESPQAYETLIERLLASPQYGEHWARYWLDLVRYADSDGFRIDDYRPSAWRYRDYVIKAFNSDKPYDRFVQEQLAGDELFPGNPEALIATGYLRHWIYEYNNRDVVTQRENILIDITDTTADVFMGVGLQCARCHDHKFDPLLQKDYFRLQAFFTPLLPRDDLVAATAQEQQNYAKALAEWNEKNAELRARIEAIEKPARARAEQQALEKFTDELKVIYNKPEKERTPDENIQRDLIARQVIYEWDRIMKYVKADDKPTLIAAQQELTAAEKNKPTALPFAFAATDVGPQAPPTKIPKKDKLGDIAPGFLTILNPDPAIIPAPSSTSTNRRSALARWLTSADQSLSTRVMVNRVWQHYFGLGLAVNSSDFGQLGQPPSHPELLDWLSRQFIADGWSLKSLHRKILLSATYRQSAQHPQATAYRTIDPENHLLWHTSTRRLQAESIRDTILSITGELDLSGPGGPGVDGSRSKRSVYVKVTRNRRDAVLDVFDVAEGFNSTASRNVTTTPKQSLLMFNSEWALARARAFANRLFKEAPKNDSERIDKAFQLAFGRLPVPEERKRLTTFLQQQNQNKSGNGNSDGTQFSLISDKLPFRDGRSAVLSPGTPQDRLMMGDRETLPDGNFTIEAFVLLRAPYPNANVRTIAARWDGNLKHSGWAFGVTGVKSRYKPMTLLLQLSSGEANQKEAEPLFSGLMLQPGRPYFVAASVQMDGTQPRVQFYTKDLSNDDETLQSATIDIEQKSHKPFTAPFTIGGRWGEQNHLWDGLIDDVRLSDRALPNEQLLLTNESSLESTLGYWRFESNTGAFSDSSLRHHNLMPLSINTGEKNVDLEAWTDLCHVLLNASEVIYVD